MKNKSLHRLTTCALMAALLCVLGPLSVPIGPIPITLATLVIYLMTYIVGTWDATISVLLYLLLGAVGLPVFSGMTGGLGKLLGMTGGYIVGFLVSALIMWAMEAIPGSRKWVLPLSMVLGLIACYAFGTAWFLVVYTRAKGAISLAAVLGMCVIPYIIPDIIKIVCALVLTRILKRFVK